MVSSQRSIVYQRPCWLAARSILACPMSDEEPFFVARNGAIWACWLSGQPATNLGPKSQVVAAMTHFLAEQGARKSPDPAIEVTTSEVTAPEPLSGAMPVLPAPPRIPQVRAGERHELTILGRLYTATGSRDVTILDLSESGCRFYDRSGYLEADSPVTIKIGTVGPVSARVKWRHKEYVGLEFDSPLYPSVLEHIRDHFNLRR
jgi:hypothetical protein